MYCTVLYCAVLYCTVLQCTALYCAAAGDHLGRLRAGGGHQGLHGRGPDPPRQPRPLPHRYRLVLYCTVLYHNVLYCTNCTLFYTVLLQVQTVRHLLASERAARRWQGGQQMSSVDNVNQSPPQEGKQQALIGDPQYLVNSDTTAHNQDTDPAPAPATN